MKSVLLSIAGYYCIVFFAFHLSFWKLFRWKADLQRITPMNQAIMQVLNLRLAYVFLMIGIALLLYQADIIGTGFGKYLLIVMSIFWIMRAIEQIIFFDRSRITSWVFVFIFLIGGGLFIVPIL
jgi:hypothetical protein